MEVIEVIWCILEHNFRLKLFGKTYRIHTFFIFREILIPPQIKESHFTLIKR